MKNHITVAIVTKNRPLELKKCLLSIYRQTKLPVNILIIDNDPAKSAKKTAQLFKEKYELPILYITQAGSVPRCRNFALKKCTTRYLGFIDDDCVLDKTWLQTGLKKINAEKLAYVLGRTLLANPQNTIALAQHGRDAYWKNYNKKIFDTKNVILDLNQIKKHSLQFDEACQSLWYDSADFDFDFQINQKKLHGANCTTMIVWHQETSNLTRFINRAYHRGRLGGYLDKKWNQQGRLSGGRDKNWLWWSLRTVKNFSKNYQQYQNFILTDSKLSKIATTFFIRLFDRYYAQGYADAKNNQ